MLNTSTIDSKPNVRSGRVAERLTLDSRVENPRSALISEAAPNYDGASLVTCMMLVVDVP